MITEREVTSVNPGYYRQDCEACHGTGRITGRVTWLDADCDQCGGTGKKIECIDAMWDYFLQYAAETIENSDEGFLKLVHSRVYLAKMMFIGFCLGNAFKYRWRKGLKDPSEQDEAKAKWYEQMARHKINPADNPDPRE